MQDPGKPQPRPLKIEAYILAYLGDLLNHYEEAIKKIAKQEASKILSTPTPQGGVAMQGLEA
jgi:hypothetical protein